jgi:5-aminolevulinate synthase
MRPSNSDVGLLSTIASDPTPDADTPTQSFCSLFDPSHIVPVCDPVLCKEISRVLIDRYGIYVQPINYPTVPRGTKRLRITPSPHRTNADIEHLVQALAEIWAELGLAKAA